LAREVIVASKPPRELSVLTTVSARAAITPGTGPSVRLAPDIEHISNLLAPVTALALCAYMSARQHVEDGKIFEGVSDAHDDSEGRECETGIAEKSIDAHDCSLLDQ
jgi:hypothetical protein